VAGVLVSFLWRPVAASVAAPVEPPATPARRPTRVTTRWVPGAGYVLEED
jgi:hypothetical protein